MKTPMTWLLAGAAFTLCAGAAGAFAGDPADAIRQAQEDARSAQVDADRARADAQRAREDARRIRDDAREIARRARAEARDIDIDIDRDIRIDRDGRETRIYRKDGDVIVIHGGGREETLSRILQLRPEQEPALRSFLDATRSERHGRGHDHMVRFDRDADGKTTLQRLDEMQAKAAEQRAEMDRKVAAIKTFYAQLDARQKQAFDAMPMLMMVGPSIGPMLLPRPMPVVHMVPPVPPVPPIPPVRPRS